MNVTNMSAGAKRSLAGVLVPLLPVAFHTMSWKDKLGRSRDGVLAPSHVLLVLGRSSDSSESSLMTSNSPERETEPVRDLFGVFVPTDHENGVRSTPMVWSKAFRRMAN